MMLISRGLVANFIRKNPTHAYDVLAANDVPVGPTSAHPDFCILHPSRGILILEVKDWKLSTIQQADKTEWVTYAPARWRNANFLWKTELALTTSTPAATRSRS